jgi:hypothetical protein
MDNVHNAWCMKWPVRVEMNIFALLFFLGSVNKITVHRELIKVEVEKYVGYP